MWRRPACQTLWKVLDTSSATDWIAPGLLKALAILSDTSVRRCAVDWEDLKPHGKSKRPHFSSWSTSLLFTSFFKDFTNHRKKTNSAVVYRDYRRDLLTIWKTFRHIYWRVLLVCMTFQPHSSLEPPLG